MASAPSPSSERGPVDLPPLPLDGWAETKDTLHRFAQIVGKIRLGAAPKRNHWWHAALYPTTRGLTTGPIPFDRQTFSLEFDFHASHLLLTTSEGGAHAVPLVGQTVAGFYRAAIDGLGGLGVTVPIRPVPYELDPPDPFPTDDRPRVYDPDAVRRWWEIVLWSDGIFQKFAGRFIGKASPIHLFWHSFDLAYTRFSGHRAPEIAGADPVTREAYSHDVISFGFWPGDVRTPYPAFYAYAAPEPESLTAYPLEPSEAVWQDTGRGHLALLAYDDVRARDDPEKTLLAFLEGAYRAGAAAAAWDPDLDARSAP